MQEIEEQIAPLLGDCTLTALSIIYLGALPVALRNSVLADWRDLLAAADINVSTSFCIHNFLQIRSAQLLGDLPRSTLSCSPDDWLDQIMLSNLAWHVPLFLDPGSQLEGLIRVKSSKKQRSELGAALGRQDGARKSKNTADHVVHLSMTMPVHVVCDKVSIIIECVCTEAWMMCVAYYSTLVA